jgi:hypothetical protein
VGGCEPRPESLLYEMLPLVLKHQREVLDLEGAALEADDLEVVVRPRVEEI